MNHSTFTVTSYNIHKGMSPLNRRVITHGLARALQELSPDILCLQEVQGQNLKRATAYQEYPDGSHHEWFGEFLGLKRSYGKNMQYPHGHHGNAVLSHYPLDPKHNVNITVSRLEKRGVLHCEIAPMGSDKTIVVLNAHLNLLHKDRIKQYQAIADYITTQIDDSQPLILAGDFNDWRLLSSSHLAELGLTEVFEATQGICPKTFPARLPVLRLDRIYVRHLTVERAWVHTGEPWSHLSDHLPISAMLSL